MSHRLTEPRKPLKTLGFLGETGVSPRSHPSHQEGGVINVKRNTYYHGLPSTKWGIWNCTQKCFQFDICEDTPMLAMARLYQKIGDDAKKWRFEVRQITDGR